jgi:c(7)-type cytochrome triheme protein
MQNLKIMKNKKFFISSAAVLTVALVVLFASYSVIFSQAGADKGGAKASASKMKLFPHKTHKDNDVKCETCHVKITESKKSRDDHSPHSKVCKDCHDAKGFTDSVIMKTPGAPVLFNHALHVKDMEQKCETCHNGIFDPNFKVGMGLPEMKICDKCHNGKDAPKKCNFCHSSSPGFSHLTHKKNDVACDSCHPNAKESKYAQDNNLPKDNVCNDCHDKDFAQTVASFDAFIPNTEFNHNKHAKEQEMPCTDCHGGIFNRVFKYGDGLPYMSKCMECHGEGEMGRCTLCHNQTAGKPMNHYVEWDKNHKAYARSHEKDCLGCHSSRKFCVDCHKGSIQPRWHAKDFINTHKIDVKFKMNRCSSCHGDNFCINCHVEYKVSPKSDLHPEHFHPEGWNDISSPNFHKIKGRRSFHTCDKCHVKSDCIFCHKKP